jgi:hypothetical protein
VRLAEGLSDERFVVTCGECQLQQTLIEAHLKEDPRLTRYRCRACGALVVTIRERRGRLVVKPHVEICVTEPRSEAPATDQGREHHRTRAQPDRGAVAHVTAPTTARAP